MAASVIIFISHIKFQSPHQEKNLIMEYMAERCFCAIYNNIELSINTIQALISVENRPTALTEM